MSITANDECSKKTAVAIGIAMDVSANVYFLTDDFAKIV